jgi:hypothetical protein
MEEMVHGMQMAEVVPIFTPKTDSIMQSIKALSIGTDALAEIALTPGAAGDRAMQALRDIKQVIVDA